MLLWQLALNMMLAPLGAWAGAQEQVGAGVLIVDRDRVLTESLPAQRLREVERSQREALSKRIEETRLSLEAEEAEIARIRDQLTPEEFETRFRAFDQRAREARLEVQRANEALQAQMIAARGQLKQALTPILQAIVEERGASVLLNAQSVLMARDKVDVTLEAIERFSALEIEFQLAPTAPTDGE